ncbi:MAG TPA: GNAT family N-acetyltransferase [Thermoanaerobaculia bacterium]|nr:GNAT family N-acetyltransferase [Thermoanaerobaculia bacterium]
MRFFVPSGDDGGTVIRLYKPGDRGVVREICRATAYGGEGVGLVEPELFVDLLTRYFTDFADRSLWVAARGERVVGYLAGCLDERRFHRVQVGKVVPAALARAIFRRGLLVRRELWRLLGSFPRFAASGGLRASPEETIYPGHLHVNLLDGFRGRSLGSRLVECFLGEARAHGLPGARAVVYESNQPARRFFERLGFHPLARRPAFKPPPREGGREWKIVYGKEL